MVGNEDARVRFIGFGASSLRLEINAYILVSTLDTALEIKEDLYLRIMDLVSESGTGFAFPSQTLYFAKDDGISEEKSKDVSDKVKEWNERGEMQLPKFHPDKIKELNDSIVYPPKGSAVNKEKP